MATLQERAHARYDYSGRPSTEVDEEASDDDEPETPKHPIASMQGPFTESIEDAALPETPNRPDRLRKLNAKARRARLLDANQPIDTYNATWRAAPEARYHPLTKILAQIAFGVHLLHQQLAKSDEEVVKILQRHVDEIDHFVTTTEEDLDLALADIKERINYLKLPLEHVKIFDAMLDDKQFRTSIIDGNDRIEQVVDRTGTLMNDLHVDIKKAMDSTAEMKHYLDRIAGHWPEDDAGSMEIYHTMQANAEGWLQCLGTLQMKGNSLGVVIAQLGRILNEISKRAGTASRRSLVPGHFKDSQSQRSSRAPTHAHSRRGSTTSRNTQREIRSPAPLSRYSKREMKALPQDPDMVARAVEATLPPQEKKKPRSHKQEGKTRSRRQEEKTPSVRHEEKTPSVRQEEKTPSIRQEEKSRSHRYQDKMPSQRYEHPRPTPIVPTVARSLAGSSSSSPKQKPKTRTKKAPPPPIRTSEKFGNFMRSASASASALSPRLRSPRFPKDSDSKSVSASSAKSEKRLESKPESTLKRARGSLMQRNYANSLGATSKPQQQEYQNQPPAGELSGKSSGGVDSAYSSGTDADRRPNTSPDPTPSLRPPANFALFPSTPPSLASSIRSPRSISSNHDTDKESVIMALPPMSHKPVLEPSPLRRGSLPGPGLKKKGSLASLLAFFKRHKGEKPVAPVATPIYELP
ncbi:hypothetical protein BLS_008639 [Venturia inaequalis]|uniref:Uncharacterized protein n=1 Tax=Venturia inaequalis TaxID=5025 RepID=A0A8H3U6L9_VENIN|nr:hypothetical protein BLS_008639 [Venturia inaequalis]